MTQLQPFRALRYSPARVELSDVLAPVYDVVAAQERARLWAAHPHAAVKLELTREKSAEAAADYADVRARLAEWKRAGILRRDSQAAFYALRQNFAAPEAAAAAAENEGAEITRLGFFASLRLENYEARIVRPHEQTMSGPKADRLKLLRAARANLSAVFLLYEDRECRLETLMENALAEAAATGACVRGRDTAGVQNELAAIQNAEAQRAVAEFFAQRPVVMADGHHRYETALAYRAEQRAAAGGAAGAADAGAERILAYFANAHAPGTLLLPTHRLLLGVAPPEESAWRRLTENGWRMCAVAAAASPEETPRLLREVLAPHAAANETAFAADDRSGRWRVFSRPAGAEISVRRIHADVLHGVFGLDEAAQRAGAVAFPKSAPQTARELAAGKGGCALYLNALRPEEVFRVAEAGETLPQKSTFFAPKLPTGLLFRELDAPE